MSAASAPRRERPENITFRAGFFAHERKRAVDTRLVAAVAPSAILLLFSFYCRPRAGRQPMRRCWPMALP